MPAIRLKVRPVTTPQPSQSVSPASRRRSLRANQREPTPRIIAAGMSQATWLPISLLNIRSSPVSPQPLAPPTEPVSSPVSRPKPL